MKGIILAAGVASRLRPLTNNTPKCLLTVGDKPILQRTIENLLLNSINDLVIVTGYLNEKIENFIADNFPEVNVEFIYNERYDSTNNIYSLWMTKQAVMGEDFILLDSDIVFDSRVLKLVLDSKFDNCLAVKSTEKLSDEEIKVTLNSDNSISEISKEVEINAAVGESVGIEKFSAEFVNKLFNLLDKMIIDEKLVNIFYEAAFQRLINEGAKIFPVSTGELKCLEVDFPEDFKKAAEEVKFME